MEDLAIHRNSVHDGSEFVVTKSCCFSASTAMRNRPRANAVTAILSRCDASITRSPCKRSSRRIVSEVGSRAAAALPTLLAGSPLALSTLCPINRRGFCSGRRRRTARHRYLFTASE
jgi:hypothetical protein